MNSTTNYKGQTVTTLMIARRMEDNGTISKYKLYVTRNKAGKVVNYGISFYRAFAVSPGDITLRSKAEALRNFPTVAEGFTIELLG